MPEKLLADDRMAPNRCFDGLHYFPRHLRSVLRDAPENLALEVFDDLRSALIPPDAGLANPFAVLELQYVRQIRVRIRQRFVVVGVIRRAFVAARSRTPRLDSELIDHVPMILD